MGIYEDPCGSCEGDRGEVAGLGVDDKWYMHLLVNK